MRVDVAVAIAAVVWGCGKDESEAAGNTSSDSAVSGKTGGDESGSSPAANDHVPGTGERPLPQEHKRPMRNINELALPRGPPAKQLSLAGDAGADGVAVQPDPAVRGTVKGSGKAKGVGNGEGQAADKEAERRLTPIQQLRAIIRKEENKPPKWVEEIDLAPYMNTVKVYEDYNAIDHASFADWLRERNPVFRRDTDNVDRDEVDVDLMEEVFKFNSPKEGIHSKDLGVCLTTPVRLGGEDPLSADLYVVNVTPPRLYDDNDSDVWWMLRETGDDVYYRKHIYNMFLRIKKCAEAQKVWEIFISGDIAVPAKDMAQRHSLPRNTIFSNAIKMLTKEEKFRVSLSGFDFDVAGTKKVNGDLEELIRGYRNGLDKFLFVNAWDAFTMVGGGPSQWDKKFRQISAMTVLAFPPTNPAIKVELFPGAKFEQVLKEKLLLK